MGMISNILSVFNRKQGTLRRVRDRRTSTMPFYEDKSKRKPINYEKEKKEKI